MKKLYGVQIAKMLMVSEPYVSVCARKLNLEPHYGKVNKKSVRFYSEEDIAKLKSYIEKKTVDQITPLSDANGGKSVKLAQSRFEKAKALDDMGVSIKEIARVLSVKRDTAKNYLECETYEQYREKFVPKPVIAPEPTQVSQTPAIEQPPVDVGGAFTIQLLRQIDSKMQKLVILAERELSDRREREKVKQVEHSNGLGRAFWRS